MMRRVVWIIGLAAGLAACGSAPPAPDWQVNAHGAVERAVRAELRGQRRVADAEWRQATVEVAATGDPARLARLALVRCAVRQAALDGVLCEGHAAQWPELEPGDAAYRRYLGGQPLPSDIERLPMAHRPLALWLADAGRSGTEGAQSAEVRLGAIQDPLARLVAASVLVRAGQRSPGLVALAVDTASAQGWREPLQAWLLLGVQQAQAAGDEAALQRWQARLRALSGQP